MRLPADPSEREELKREALRVAGNVDAVNRALIAGTSDGQQVIQGQGVPVLMGPSTDKKIEDASSTPHFDMPVEPSPTFTNNTSLPVAFSEQKPVMIPSQEHADQAHTDCIYQICLTTEYIISSSRDTTIRVWSLETGTLVYPPLRGHTASALCIAVSVPLDLLISGSVDGKLILWRLSTGAQMKILAQYEQSVLSVAISPKYVVAGSKDQSVRVWSVADVLAGLDTESVIQPITSFSHTASVLSVIIDPSEAFVISGAGDRTIKMVDTATWTSSVRHFTGHTKGVACLALSDSKLISGSTDNTIRVWDLATGNEEQCLGGHTDLVRCLHIVPSSPPTPPMMLSGSYDRTVILWAQNTEDGSWNIQKRFSAEDEAIDPKWDLGPEIRVFKVVSDGQRIYCVGQGSKVLVWEL